MHKNTIAGAIGNAIEWYDFAIFGFSAPVISHLFFPATNPITSLLAVYVLFAIGFISRPLGSFIFGYIGDHFGRATTLKLTVWFMSGPTILIGLLPTYAVIGIWCPIIIAVLRLLQGVAMGGEFTGSIIYLTETAPTDRRGLLGSFGYVSTTSGILIGSGTIALTQMIFTPQTLLQWGWRLPFLAALLIGAIAYYLRKDLPESPLQHFKTTSFNPIIEAFRKNALAMLQVVGLNFFMAVGFYTFFIFTESYLIKVVGTSNDFALNLNTICLLLLMCMMPLSGWLSDRLGRKPVLAITVTLIMILVYPAYQLMSADHLALTALAMLVIALLFGLFQGGMPILLVSLFPPQTRASGLSISFNVSNALFGGTAPAVATWLIKSLHHETWFLVYIIFSTVIFLVTLFCIRINEQFL